MPAYAGFLQALTTIFIAIRIAARVTRQGTEWGCDDVFIILAYVSIIAS